MWRSSCNSFPEGRQEAGEGTAVEFGERGAIANQHRGTSSSLGGARRERDGYCAMGVAKHANLASERFDLYAIIAKRCVLREMT
jgi:hypothetical protein